MKKILEILLGGLSMCLIILIPIKIFEFYMWIFYLGYGIQSFWITTFIIGIVITLFGMDKDKHN